MMNIFMWLFVNDYGSVGFISGLFLVLLGILLIYFSLFFLLILDCLIEKTLECLIKKICLLELFNIIVYIIIITIFISFTCFIFDTSFKIFTKSHVSLIPQYGTQAQKEMLAICIQDKRPNGLTEEDKKDIDYAMEDIMLDCKRKYNKLEEKRKQELKHRKFLLKNKEILDSLDKMLIKQGIK